MKIKIKKLDHRAKLPLYAHPHDAGLDLFCLEPITILAWTRAVIRTGLAFEIPEGYVGLVWDKSGLAFKNGLTTMSGVLDAGYRGELKLLVFNASDADYEFAAGDKVAQLLIQPVERVAIEGVAELSDTNRGAGGFGSTGR